MEIETKIFDIKKIRKVLAKEDITPCRICDITDFLFDIEHFSGKNWKYTLPLGKKSGQLGIGDMYVEVPDVEALMSIREFCEERCGRGSKIRIRLIDSVPYVTFKGTKKTNRGVKSREEIETPIGSLSSMMSILLSSGAKLEKSIFRIREIYGVPGYKHAELIIDRFESAHGTLEYAELECRSEVELHKILAKVFHIDPKDISDAGITDLHAKKMKQSVSRKLTELEELVGD